MLLNGSSRSQSESILRNMELFEEPVEIPEVRARDWRVS
jgi:hypothetical protein